MELICNIDRDTYEAFVENNPYKSHYLQSYAWGEFCQKDKNFIPHYIGLMDNNSLVAATLLLEKKLPMHYCYFYIPRGFVMNMNDSNLLKIFITELKKYAKSKRAIFIKLDSDIVYHQEDCFGNTVELPYSGEKILKDLVRLGFHHLGFTKNFDLSQPRYTFRIDFKKPLEEIKNNFSKTTKQRIKKAEELGIEVKIGTEEDIPTFFELMRITEDRKDFITHGLQYYQDLYHIWKQHNDCDLFLGIANIPKILDILSKKEQELTFELKTFENIQNLSKSQNSKKKELNRQLEKLQEDIQKYRKYQQEYGNEITLSAHFIIAYGNKAWVLYAGNHNILSETYTNYKTYETHIEYYYQKGIEIYDQFGTIGDLRKENPLYGLHEFKKKFGGDYVEFIGEFDLTLNKAMYLIFQKFVPFYRRMKFRVSQHELTNQKQ